MEIKVNISSSLSGVQAMIDNFAKDKVNTIIRTVATSMLPVIRTRIHEQGLAADGSDIGQYNKTTPIYVNPLTAPKAFPKIGKGGKDKFKSGRSHVTGYFPSYDAFKTAVDRNELGKVNLSLSGQLAAQFVVIATENGYGLGWLDTEKYKRAKFFEDTKYKKPIWALTPEENNLVTEIVHEEIDNSFGSYKY